jgi:hypothetical protein
MIVYEGCVLECIDLLKQKNNNRIQTKMYKNDKKK